MLQLNAAQGLTDLSIDVSCFTTSSSAIGPQPGLPIQTTFQEQEPIKQSTTSVGGASTSSTVSATDPASSVHTSVSSTIASPTGTSTSPLPSSPVSKHGLSTGAKAGIAIGAVGVVLIALLVAFLVRRRRHRLSKDNDVYNAPETKEIGPSTSLGDWPHLHTGVQKLPDKDPTHTIDRQKLSTSANGLELETPKRDGQSLAGMQRSELPTPANRHELDAHAGTKAPLQSPNSHSHPPPQQTFSQPFESFEPVATQLPNTQHEPVTLGASSQTIHLDTSTAEGSFSQIDTLLAKREKIRVEKERLLTLQELDEMEAIIDKGNNRGES
ncbi:hypothetical protein V491_00885 [Pseudogymnoascus sp. VKM F-3775]|nr:hypothetical protein V491_00885 [Pseudogymnoascus sp. VKM F-3775]